MGTWGTIGSALGSYFGPVGTAIGGGLGNAIDGQQTNRDNKKAAQRQMNFQQYNADTAHQREVADLKAAGLNPILSAGGNGAPAPSGAMSTAVTPPAVAMPDLMAYGISMRQLDQNDQRLQIDRANSAAAISKTLSDTDLNKMKKLLYQKGMIRAELEGEGADMMRNIIKWMKKSVRDPKVPTYQEGMEQGIEQRFP